MSSSSSDPTVQHVWTLLAKASVEHELAHKHRTTDATITKSHAHEAVRFTKLAAEAIRDTLETEEQFRLILELENRFRPVLFRCIRDVIDQKRRRLLRGGNTSIDEKLRQIAEIKSEIETCVNKIRETQGQVAQVETEIISIMKRKIAAAAEPVWRFSFKFTLPQERKKQPPTELLESETRLY